MMREEEESLAGCDRGGTMHTRDTVDISSLEGTREQGDRALIRAAVSSLRKKAGQRDYTKTRWVQIRDNVKRNKYRIVKRVGHVLYYRWDALGAYPPRGMSLQISIGDFLRDFDPVGRQDVV